MSIGKGIVTDVLGIVSVETDVPVERIMSRCSEVDVVDARWICVKLLNIHGLYTSRIAEAMKITPRYVQYILTDFEDRIGCARIMRNNYERAANKLRRLCEKTAYIK